MALNYRPVDRDQSFLLPPDMRDWLPGDHLAWFVLEVIESLDMSGLEKKSKRGGTGREGYDPAMLLGLWLYASARGISSSRGIERACWEDVAFRVLCGQDVPDHTVLARFRQRHQEVMADLFAQVLALCVGQGLGRFGVIAIDGTKIKANASKDKTVSLKRLRKLAAAELEKAEATDQAEDASNAPAPGDDLPPGMGPGSDRLARIKKAIAGLEVQINTDNAPQIAGHEQRLARSEKRLAELVDDASARRRRHEDATAQGVKALGRPPVDDNAKVKRARSSVETARAQLEAMRQKITQQTSGVEVGDRRFAKRNTTDPESRIMKTRSGFIQGYNAQLAVTDDGLIVAAEVTDQPNDLRQLVPMMRQAEAMRKHCQTETGRTDLVIGTILADNGYLSDDNVHADGPDRLIAPGRGAISNGQWVGKRSEKRQPSAAAKIMLTKLNGPENQALYQRRSVTVEPVNGHLKDRRGLRQFARRGKDAVQAELLMAALTTNLMKLFTGGWKPATIIV